MLGFSHPTASGFRPYSATKLLLMTFLVLFTFSATALASTNEIEGVWSFGGGSVAVQQLSDGTFQGTVVLPTTFASCSHPVGQAMWTDMSQQSDGSFWGYHQWYRGLCEPDPQLGPTTWRVLHTSDGQRYLKVCFSNPGTPQPKIDAAGSETGATYGCMKSALVAPLPSIAGSQASLGGNSDQISFTGAVVLPTSRECVRHRSLTIKLHDPKYDPLKEVVVRISGKRIATVHGIESLKKNIVLYDPPNGTYTVSVLAITVLRQRLFGSRAYQACMRPTRTIKLRPDRPRKPS